MTACALRWRDSERNGTLSSLSSGSDNPEGFGEHWDDDSSSSSSALFSTTASTPASQPPPRRAHPPLHYRPLDPERKGHCLPSSRHSNTTHTHNTLTPHAPHTHALSLMSCLAVILKHGRGIITTPLLINSRLMQTNFSFPGHVQTPGKQQECRSLFTKHTRLPATARLRNERYIYQVFRW